MPLYLVAIQLPDKYDPSLGRCVYCIQATGI
jgi:hypothetical protein